MDGVSECVKRQGCWNSSQRTERNLMPQASTPSLVEGVRVTGSSVAGVTPRSVTTPVQTIPPAAAVAWQPYWLSLHMKEKASPVTLILLANMWRFSRWTSINEPGTTRYCANSRRLARLCRSGRRTGPGVASGTCAPICEVWHIDCE